jgi:hypothetical protein
VRSFNISEEIGVVLIGLSVYDALNLAWIYPTGLVQLQAGGFGWVRAALVSIFCLFIASSLAISHQTNIRSSTNGIAGLRKKSARELISLIVPTAIGQTLSGFAIAIAWYGLGPKQAFLVFLGFLFANSGPWIDRWTSRL